MRTILPGTRTFPLLFLSHYRRQLLSLISLIRNEYAVFFSSSSVAFWSCSNNVIMAGSQDIHEYLETAKKLVLETGEIFKCGIASEKKIETKSSDWDLVTECDKNIEDILVKELSTRYPDHKFIGEESTAASNKLPELTDSPTWLIDPIDGTTNFIHAFPQCCISVGLTVCKRLELGIIYNPSNNEMYTAIRGEGAFLNGKCIRTSTVTELKKALIYFEPGTIRVPSKYRDINMARLEAISCTAQGVRSFGSVALGLAYVASGTLDALQMDHLGPWDVAAGQLIVEEAGGTVIDTRGGCHDVMKPRTIATSTESLAKEISKLIVDIDLQTQRKRFKRIPSSSKLL